MLQPARGVSVTRRTSKNPRAQRVERRTLVRETQQAAARQTRVNNNRRACSELKINKPSADLSCSSAHSPFRCPDLSCFSLSEEEDLEDVPASMEVNKNHALEEFKVWSYLTVTSTPSVNIETQLPYVPGPVRDQEQYMNGAKVFLGCNRITVGRAPSDCDLIVGLALVSGIHFVMERHPLEGLVTLTDQSSNGTKLNGVPMMRKHPVALKDGDFIKIAPGVEFVFNTLCPVSEYSTQQDEAKMTPECSLQVTGVALLTVSDMKVVEKLGHDDPLSQSIIDRHRLPENSPDPTVQDDEDVVFDLFVECQWDHDEKPRWELLFYVWTGDSDVLTTFLRQRGMDKLADTVAHWS